MITFKDRNLKDYLDRKIRPLYRNHDGGHNEEHLDEVLGRALELASHFGIPHSLVMTCAYHHDTGLKDGREGHELRSADYLRHDKNLLRWFREDQIEEKWPRQ